MHLVISARVNFNEMGKRQFSIDAIGQFYTFSIVHVTRPGGPVKIDHMRIILHSLYRRYIFCIQELKNMYGSAYQLLIGT